MNNTFEADKKFLSQLRIQTIEQLIKLERC
jgi:hypothetical protein